MSIKIIILTLILFFFPIFAFSAELLVSKQEIVKSEVVGIGRNEFGEVSGTGDRRLVQEITAKILEGEMKGKLVEFDNDYVELELGDKFYLRHTIDPTGGEYYAVSDPYRLGALGFLFFIFIILTLVFGGLQGLRGLLALFGSFLLIAYVLLPGIFAGFSPIFVSLSVASLIIILGSYITHGFNITTSSAVIGMIATVTITGLLGFVAMSFTKLTGYESDEVIYFALNQQGEVDILGILFSGIIIGLLGVLYDSAIGQAIAVEELIRAGGGKLHPKTVYLRAIRIGREHIGALVNTLAIAYVGASLPLFLLFYGSSFSPFINLNSEVVATEIVRILIGSIGLVLTVPITTIISVYMLKNRQFGEIDHHHKH